MSDIRFNRWLHQSGTGGVSQDSSGNIGIGTTVPTMALDIRGDVNIGDTININNASGIISATTFTGTTGTFSGNVSIAGTLTYEDVSNIDAVGIITAQSDIIVGGGLTVTGISTFNNDVKLLDNDKLKFGIGEDLQIYQSSSASNIKSDLLILRSKQGLGDPYITCTQGGSVALRYSGTPRFETTTTGAIVTGILTATTFSGNLTGNVTGDLTGNLAGISSIASISSSISDTAVDVFVYDTRKDSDGGAWRKRTQNTSWYNETLNTSTRGSRKEFPAVAVIVAETSKVTIYDGDDPDMPMWMVFNATAARSLIGYQSANVDSIKALNASLVVGAASELNEINFLRDDSFRIGSTASWYTTNNISQRNVNFTLFTDDGRRTVSNGDYYVAMTVLPNAPVDDTTGLPVPTIAVATDGGTSVITDDGNVFDLNVANRPYSSVYFSPDNLVWAVENPGGVTYDLLRYFQIPTADITTAPSYGPSSNPALFPSNTKGNIFDSYAYGSPIGLSIIDHADGTATATSGMVVYIASDYNTGWMHGDIKGAFLSDTDATNVSAVVVNSATSSWSQQGTSNWTITSATEITVSSVASGNSATLRLTTDSSKQYVYSFNITVLSDNLTFRDDQGNEIEPIPTSTGVYTGNFTGTSYVDFTVYQTDSATITSINISEAEEDRSVNNKGLQVFGTVTKSAVATGAELVAYSGFDASNGLIQPYNSDLEFGTGDYYMSIWAYGGGDGQVLMVREHGTSDADGAILLFQQSNIYAFYSRQDGTSSWTSTVSSTGYGSRWNHVTMVRTGGTLYGYVNGKLETSIAFSGNVTNNDATLNIGRRNPSVNTQYFTGSLALAKIGSGAPSSEQIKKMYEDEKCLFHENAKATLYGSSDAVTGLAFDDTTNLLHVGTSAGRSEFQGLSRINNTTDAVTTAISASNGLVAEQ